MKKLIIHLLVNSLFISFLLYSCSTDSTNSNGTNPEQILSENELILQSFEGTYYWGIKLPNYYQREIVISSGKIEIDDIWYGLMVESENKLSIYVIDNYDIQYDYLSVEKTTGAYDLYLNIYRSNSFYFESYNKIE